MAKPDWLDIGKVVLCANKLTPQGIREDWVVEGLDFKDEDALLTPTGDNTGAEGYYSWSDITRKEGVEQEEQRPDMGWALKVVHDKAAREKAVANVQYHYKELMIAVERASNLDLRVDLCIGVPDEADECILSYNAPAEYY